jgi:hypothetical protein
MAASFLAGTTLMFSGAYFPRVFAGHLTMLAVLAWTPMVFLCVDKLLAKPRVAWMIIGALTLGMQVMAGLPQGVFCTVVAVAAYAGLELASSPKQRIAKAAAMAGMFALPLLVTAIQFWPALWTAAECSRAQGLSYEAASSYSFPPENLLMLVCPNFFGIMRTNPYWGRWLLWEVCFFAGSTGLLLSLHAAFSGTGRRTRIPAALVLFTLVLALGSHTPVFGLLNRFVPGFDMFRAPARFLFFTTLFLALLAAIGIDMLKRAKPRLALPAVWMMLALACGAAGSFFVLAGKAGENVFTAAVEYLRGLAGFLSAVSAQPRPEMAVFTGKALLVSSGVLALAAILFLLCRRTNRAVLALVALGVLEMAGFAAGMRTRFPLSEVSDNKPRSYGRVPLADDDRFLDDPRGNRAIHLGVHGIWGYDPMMLRRYTEFISHTQRDREISASSEEMTFKNFMHPYFRLLRCRYIAPQAATNNTLVVYPNPMPHVLLMHKYILATNQEEAFTIMDAPSFNCEKTVVLESEPEPRPGYAAARGSAKVIQENTDSLRIQVSTPAAAILLVTDPYSSGWRARAANPTKAPQPKYEVLPADHALRAIPLAQGNHEIILEYVPQGWPYGKCVSLITLSVLIAAALWRLATKRHHSCSQSQSCS